MKKILSGFNGPGPSAATLAIIKYTILLNWEPLWRRVLICYSQRVNATSQYNNVAVRDVQNGRTGWDRCSGETLLAPCTRKKRLQRKITKHYHWIGVQENIGMFSKS